MNCQTFSELASDIARDQMMDAVARAQALAHANDCVSCAVQMRNQQRLTSDLRELSAATKDENSSPVVWERLSAAFDSRTISHIKTKRRRMYAAGAIAAMLIVAFVVVQLIRHRQSINVEATIAATFASVLPVQTNDKEKDVILAVNHKPQVVRHRLYPAPRALTPTSNQPKEIATDFIPLTYDGEVGSDAQMVRVELPRSAMANFGLPVNMDRADQRVKADVLLGADGLARAIRFVQ
jgi:hypothetical protein